MVDVKMSASAAAGHCQLWFQLTATKWCVRRRSTKMSC